MPDWLVIETESKGGEVRSAAAFESLEECIEECVTRAEDDGYIDEDVTADDLRKGLAEDRSYLDGGVLTSIVKVVRACGR